MGIKNRLSALMKEKNTNANDLAQKIGVAPTTIYSIMQRDSARIDIDLILKISHALGITADELLSDELHEMQVSPTSFELELIAAYRKADEGTKSSVCKLLDINPEGLKKSETSTDMLA